MNRRSFLQVASLTAAALVARRGPAFAQSAAPPAASVSFNHDWLVAAAKALSEKPYSPASAELPDGYGDITYDQYRNIWFKPDQSLWAADPSRFRIDMFHQGFIYKDPVKLSIVDAGQATPVAFSPAMFGYGHLVKPPAHPEGMDFAGFRARTQINSPGSWQEFLVFQGASYFRAVARDQTYGLSARGLAINTAEPEGEEFPWFRHFWLERPSREGAALVVHALLDSPSTAGAYRFEITPGMETVMDVDASIFPRQEIKKLGIAPLTSMFMFNPMNRTRFDDFRLSVHDSNGLQMLNGAGEWLWRPLCNPSSLQISFFRDKSPRGFGLMQRARRYEDFQDLEARYESRPSLWIEPLGDWGEGFVELVEIPTEDETNDNIVAYWRPNGSVPAGGPWHFSYRMHWTDLVRPQSEMLWVADSYQGLTFDKKRRLFVVDFRAADDAPVQLEPENLLVQVSATRGHAVNPVIHERRPGGTIRASFELDAGSEELSELRLLLTADGKPASETWLYRWTAS